MITRIFYATIGLLFMIFIIKSVKKNNILEKESFFWLSGAIFIFILSIFPKIIDNISNLIGIEYPPSLLFLVGIIFILIITFRLTKYISLIKEQNKELAQMNSIFEKRINDLERKMNI